MPDFLSFTTQQAILISNLIFAILAVSFLLLYIKEHLTNKDAEKEAKRILEESQRKGYEIINQAMKKADAIVSESDLTAIKSTSKLDADLKSLGEKEKQALSSTANREQQAIIQATEDFKSYLDYLSKQSDNAVSSSELALRERINDVIEKFEQNLSQFLTQTQDESSKAITLEMQSARQLIQTYKTEQFNLIDENIVATLERTLNLVLAKKLSLKDHIDLVFESLEKAKAEKFLA